MGISQDTMIAFICESTPMSVPDPHYVNFWDPTYVSVLPSWAIAPYRGNISDPIWLTNRGVDIAALNHYRNKSLEESILRREFKTNSIRIEPERVMALDTLARDRHALREVRNQPLAWRAHCTV